MMNTKKFDNGVPR
ncbi:hypothetical protein L195_g061216, partial [Trifolium pratense]